MKYIISVSSVCRLLSKDSHTPVHCCPTETGALTAAERPTRSTVGNRGTVLEMKFSLPACRCRHGIIIYIYASANGNFETKGIGACAKNKYIWIKADASLLKHLIAARNDLKMTTFKIIFIALTFLCNINIRIYSQLHHNYASQSFHRHAHFISICCLRVVTRLQHCALLHPGLSANCKRMILNLGLRCTSGLCFTPTHWTLLRECVILYYFHSSGYLVC